MAKAKSSTGAMADSGQVIKNRTRRLANHIKRQPNDEQAKAALKKGLKYRRKAPINKIWTKATRQYAHILRLLGYNGMSALARKRSFADTEESTR